MISGDPSWEEALRRIEECKANGGRELNLSELYLGEIPDEVRTLKNLQWLKVLWNGLDALPDWLADLNNLQVLDLSGNRFTELPNTLANLIQLQSLRVAGNRLTSLPGWLAKLVQLRSLDVKRNRLTTLPKEVAEFKQLRSVNLSHNKISHLPVSLTDLTQLQNLYLHDNPLNLPPEVVGYKPEPAPIPELFAYLRSLGRDRAVPLTEVKVLVVGEAGTGKTSTVRRLVEHNFDPKRDPTPGIAIRDWQLRVQSRNLTLHLWDFGGQEIMHNTHQFFLTERSLYLLVLDSTQDEQANGVIKWLKTIDLYAPDAPVIVALNKWDKGSLTLNQKEIRAIHANTVFVEISCATGKGFATLRATMESALRAMPHLNDPISARWMNVRRDVANAGRDYLPFTDFRAACVAHNVADVSDSIAQVLHWLGVLLTYSNDRATRFTHILNPNWVTDGIYPILTDKELSQRGGFVTDHDLARILPAERYPPDKHSFILGMMFNFELAYELERGRYLVPDLLPKEPPAHRWDDAGALRFVYEYDFLPLGIFSRFVVQMQEQVNPDLVWRTGVLLHLNGQPYARLIEEREARRISLSLRLPEGTRRDPRTLLDTLRDRFDALHGRFKGLKVEELVPIPGAAQMIPYADLLDLERELEREGIETHYFPRIGRLNVRDLLDSLSHRRRGGKDENKPDPEPMPRTPHEKNRYLVKIIVAALGDNPRMKQTLMAAAGLTTEHFNFDFGMNGEDFAWDVLNTLRQTGNHPDSNEPALNYLLRELQKRRRGFPDEVKFLQEMERGG